MKYRGIRMRGRVSQQCNPNLRVSAAEFTRGQFADPATYKVIRPLHPIIRKIRKATGWVRISLEGRN